MPHRDSKESDRALGQLKSIWKNVFGFERLRGRRSSWNGELNCPHGDQPEGSLLV